MKKHIGESSRPATICTLSEHRCERLGTGPTECGNVARFTSTKEVTFLAFFGGSAVGLRFFTLHRGFASRSGEKRKENYVAQSHARRDFADFQTWRYPVIHESRSAYLGVHPSRPADLRPAGCSMAILSARCATKLMCQAFRT